MQHSPEAVRLASDYAFYAPRCLKIRTKAGGVEPFAFNAAQRYIHERAEDQRKRTGRVRLIVLKGRQQGCSTYIEGRAYHFTTTRLGVRTFILTHEAEATANLFDMAARFHDNAPRAVRPTTGAANAKELYFDRLDSGYKVGTAGSKGTGRSQTVQFFHGSEVAFWPHADTHASGVMQAVPDAPDTEVWLESTADGMGGFFHKTWEAAVRGEGQFEAVFVPWFWQPEYAKELPPDFEMRGDEGELAEIYKLSPEKIYWRRQKISELGSVERFRQEYPNNPDEAFLSSVDDVVIHPDLVRAAVNREIEPLDGKPTWGVDVARFGSDRTALAKRRRNVLMERIQSWHGKSVTQVAGLVLDEYMRTPVKDRPHRINVDVIGIGAGVVDILQDADLPAVGVNVAETPAIRDRYMRLRDELWYRGREWFEDRRAKMPADDALTLELTATRYTLTAGGKIQVEPKAKTKERLGFSPDLADAFLLTFATPDHRPNETVAHEPTYYEDS